jgi:DNA gyrase subunit A
MSEPSHERRRRRSSAPDAGGAEEGNGRGSPSRLAPIEPIEIQEEMERSFLEYSMSVIVSRALPDVRDGLKPVHRRILYAMYEQNLRPDRPYTKCARVVGDVMGAYHPHGDTAIYDALVRMAQDFSLRYVLVDGHGNFGGRGPDDGPAAMRYTECRLSPITLELMAGIDEETVDFAPNYDGTQQEPVVLPSRFPNLLVNGSQGIAVGMATNIAPHNLREVVDAVVYVLEHPDASPEELMTKVQGPDFPTGGLILGREGIRDAYRTGKGSIKLRAVAEIEPARSGPRIVVSEIPYQTSVEAIEERIAELVKAGELDGITRVQNDSAGRRVRLVIDLRRDANANVVLNKLFKLTPLETVFAVNTVALVDGVPRTLNLAELVGHYVAHQIEVVRRRSQFRLRRARERAHVVEGLLRAIDMLDQVIEAIRGSEDRAAARAALMAEPFDFSEVQANHILDMTLGRLTRLARSELEEERASLLATIADLEAILEDDRRLRGVIAEDLQELARRFGDERRTRIVNDPGDLGAEDLIDDEELVVTLTQSGYVKAVPAGLFRTQGRGGRGVQGTRLKDADLVRDLVHTTAHAHVLMFSTQGRVFRLRAHEIPVKERTARGTAVVNLVPLRPDEGVRTLVATREFDHERYLLFATRKGQVKKTSLREYDKSRREGFIAIGLQEDDELVRVVLTSGDDEVLLVTRQGMAIRFSERDVRPMSREAAGVRGVRLRSGDEVVSCDVVRPDADLLVVTSGGYGKRTKVARFAVQGRGGQGVRAIRLTDARGTVVGAFMASLEDEVLVVSSEGVVIRTPVAEVASQGRDATGVRLMQLAEGQAVTAAALVAAGDAGA